MGKYEINYPVTDKMKKVWMIELDLLDQFSQVCEKNGLCYFIDGGTLLGAVRHGGFIPWDDDVDVIMPRKDYDRLCEIAGRVFEYPYYFQTAMTEKLFFRAHAQLRNSKTTGFIYQDRNKNINKGIFLDIFVLDGIADSYFQRKIQKLQNIIFRKILSYASDREYSELSRVKKALYKILHLSYQIIPFKTQFEYFNHKVLAKYSYKRTKIVGDLTLGWRTNVQWKSEWFDGYILLPFENLYLRAPIQYEKVLEKQYGDYMRIPNENERERMKMHDKIFFEPDIPYTDSIETCCNAIERFFKP